MSPAGGWGGPSLPGDSQLSSAALQDSQELSRGSWGQWFSEALRGPRVLAALSGVWGQPGAPTLN
eukprot:7496620-Alexandrium_andersonii.AAC.1